MTEGPRIALSGSGGIGCEEKDGKDGARKNNGVASGHKGVDANHVLYLLHTYSTAPQTLAVVSP